MTKQRSTFEEGARNNGIDGELAIKIFDSGREVRRLRFNKSHSAAYALVSYQTLWMKTHYPAEFMAAVMSADMDNTEKIVTLVDECENMKLTLLPPRRKRRCVHKFTVNLKGEIVYGIGAIKGVGEAPVDAILEARSNGGPFKDLFDFYLRRVDLKRINKRVTEKLIYAGALDQLGPEKTQPARATLLASLQDAMRAADQHKKAESLGQSDLFGLLATEPDEVEQAFIKATPLT